MSSLSLRKAMESEDQPIDSGDSLDANKTVVMKGPLSEVYTQALQEAYAKEPGEEGQAVMESAAMDVQMMTALAQAVIGADVPPAAADEAITVFGVNEQSLQDQNVVELTKELAATPDPENFVVIIDGTQPGANGEAASTPTERVEMLSSAMECISQAYGARVFRSLGDFAKARK